MVDELKPTPRYRRLLRITWTVAWGVLAVSLVALWVRSYYVRDVLFYNGSAEHRRIELYSGIVEAGVSHKPLEGSAWMPSGWSYQKHDWSSGTFETPYTYYRIHFYVRLWWVALGLLCTAGIPWLPLSSKQFSRCTMLLLTTAIAVFLGLAVWAVG